MTHLQTLLLHLPHKAMVIDPKTGLKYPFVIRNETGDLKYGFDIFRTMFYKAKLALYPLSDANETISLDGESIRVADLLIEEWNTRMNDNVTNLKWLLVKHAGLMDAPYWFVKRLLDYHIDVSNAIGNGYAVDVKKVISKTPIY